MASRAIRNTFCKLGFAKSISLFMKEQHPGEIPAGLLVLLDDLDTAVEAAYACWSERLIAKDVKIIQQKLEAFAAKTWQGKSRNLQTYTSFAVGLLVDLAAYIRDTRKKRAVYKVIDCLTAIYDWCVAMDGEHIACGVGAMRAVEIWDKEIAA